MGCGGSKTLDLESERIPAKIRPLLRRRYEEIKDKSRNIAPGDPKDTNSLSKKELLNKNNNMDDRLNDNEVIDDHRRSQSFEEENEKVVPEPQEMIRTEKGGVTKTPVAVPKLPSSPTNQAQCNATLDLSLNQKSVNAKEGIVSEDGEEKEEEKEDSGWEGGINSWKERHIWPASPSFREYLPETVDNEENNDHGNHGTDKDAEMDTMSQSRDDETNKKSDSESSHETAESTNSNEGSVTKITKKRGKRGMKFKRVLTKPKARAMKNLLNVKCCYYPAGSRHDNTSLLEIKAAA